MAWSDAARKAAAEDRARKSANSKYLKGVMAQIQTLGNRHNGRMIKKRPEATPAQLFARNTRVGRSRCHVPVTQRGGYLVRKGKPIRVAALSGSKTRYTSIKSIARTPAMRQKSGKR